MKHTVRPELVEGSLSKDEHTDQPNRLSLPARFTASNRIKEFPTEKSKNCIAQLMGNNEALSYRSIEATFGELCGKVENTDLKQTARVSLSRMVKSFTCVR